MFKRFMASTVAIMLITSSNAVVYADPEDDKESMNLIKIEQPLNVDDVDEEETAKSTNTEDQKEDDSWIHIVSPKVDPKDNSVYNDGELVVSVRIDSDEDVYFKLMKVKDDLTTDEQDKELSDADKFIVYSLAVNTKIKSDKEDTEKAIIENEIEVVDVDTNEESQSDATEDDIAQDSENNEDAIPTEVSEVLEENPEDVVIEEDINKEPQPLTLIHSEKIEPDDVIGVNPIPLKDMKPGEYRLLFFKESFYDEIVDLGKDNNNGDIVINIDKNDNKFEVIELIIKPSIKVLEETLDSNSVTEILLGE